jgi:hypothetical protein
VRQYHLEAWVSRNESKLVKFGQDLARPALTVGKAPRRCWRRWRHSWCWSCFCS